MSRENIEVRECDRCKTRVEARTLDAFAGWGSANAAGDKDGQRTGFANADLCPQCFDFLIDWFSLVMRERDAARVLSPSTAVRRCSPIKPVEDHPQSIYLDAYLAPLDDIASLEALAEYQARNAIDIMRWMGDPALSQRLTAAHQSAYERLYLVSQGDECA